MQRAATLEDAARRRNVIIQKPKKFSRSALSYFSFAALTRFRISSSLKCAASHLSTSATV